jgi:hypothetical protein
MSVWFTLRKIVGCMFGGIIHLEDCLLLRFGLRYAVFDERTQHVFPHLPLRSESARDYLFGMSRIVSDAFFAHSKNLTWQNSPHYKAYSSLVFRGRQDSLTNPRDAQRLLQDRQRRQ